MDGTSTLESKLIGEADEEGPPSSIEVNREDAAGRVSSKEAVLTASYSRDGEQFFNPDDVKDGLESDKPLNHGGGYDRGNEVQGLGDTSKEQGKSLSSNDINNSGGLLYNIDIESNSGLEEDHLNFEEGEGEDDERKQSKALHGDKVDVIPVRRPNHSEIHMRHVEYLFSIRGWDNFHIYLWILKDLAWTLDNFWMSAVCGSMAVAWCGILVAVAYRSEDWEEIYMLVSTILWIVGNFWWMAAETDIVGDDDTHALQTSYMLETGLGWLAIFYLVLRPLNVIKETPAVTQQFLVLDLHPRFSYFKNWRQYEYLHMLFWISKDLSWNRYYKPTWWAAFVMTTLLGIDFIWVSYKKGYVVDVAHYVAQLFWVFANGAWAYGELYTDLDDPYPVGDANPTAVKTGRWWASVLLVISFIPILLLYFVWFPYMYLKTGDTKDDDPQVPTLSAVFFDPRSPSVDNPTSDSSPGLVVGTRKQREDSKAEGTVENPTRQGTL
jgi:hypothetical protein